MPTLLIIDDETSICFAFKRFFQKRGFDVHTTQAPAEALQLAENHKPFLIFLDVKLGSHDGLELLPKLKEAAPAAKIVVITAFGSLETVQRAFDLGACEYLTKPLDMSNAERLVIQASADTTDVQDAPKAEAGYVGSSHVMQNLFKKLLKVANLDEPVLVSGPTGTGKELAAKLIHQKGARNNGPFIPVNCGAIPDNLIESELFGHCKGSFTGAINDKTGLCQAAHNGILFLDEIGELPLHAQVKLLRFLDSKTVERIGDVKPHPVNVRVISATNVNLQEAVANGTFRADLYYRLAVLEIKTPPLIDHLEDIPELARHFLHTLNPSMLINDEALELLRRMDWPGNVRQLKNVITQATLETNSNVITPDCIPQSKTNNAQNTLQRYVQSLDLSNTTMEQEVTTLQRLLVQKALDETGNNQSAAASLLGLHRNSIHRIMQ